MHVFFILYGRDKIYEFSKKAIFEDQNVIYVELCWVNWLQSVHWRFILYLGNTWNGFHDFACIRLFLEELKNGRLFFRVKKGGEDFLSSRKGGRDFFAA